MFKRLRYGIASVMFLFAVTQASSQVAMPDTMCIGTNRLYHVNDATSPSTYTWKIDGITQTATTNEISITWNTAGKFSLTVQEHSAAGCDGDIRSGFVYVKPVTTPNAGADAVICFGTPFKLNGSGGTSYQWTPSTYLSNPNIPNPRVNIPTPGVFTYVLNVTDTKGCKSSDTDSVVLTVLPQVIISAGRDTSVALNQPLQLNVVNLSSSLITSYTWSPPVGLNNSFIKNPVAILDHNMAYTVTASSAEGCDGSDDINIKVFSKAELYVPTAFTPNGDGKNDLADVIPVGIRELRYFSIYNRFGQMIFTTKDPHKGWDGQVGGKEQATATFAWIAEGIDFQGNVIFRKGTVTLIR